MNGKNIQTGTVHNARADKYNGISGLFSSCTKIGVRNVAFLTETTEAVTCSKCLKANPAPVTKAAPAKISGAQAKVMKALAGGGWTNWRALGVGASTLTKMVQAGLIEADADEINYRAI
jgi:hypothetical protein